MRLRIYLAPSGQWAGILLDGDEEIGRVAGCSGPDEVEEAAYNLGFDFSEVETV